MNAGEAIAIENQDEKMDYDDLCVLLTSSIGKDAGGREVPRYQATCSEH